ncbi:MAG TPA: hypothetical protein VMV53_02535 [Acidimicrobiales bacterium]|nr:hypothetical protein [Acidimicrobiales bacterium]
MDATLAAVADSLGTTVHRVTRAVERMDIRLSGSAKRGGPGRTLTEGDVERLRSALGSAPRTRAFTREELFLLAALAAEPRGFASIRALARSAGVSPTTAAAGVERLARRHLVMQKAGLTRMSGRVVDATLIVANHSSAAWSRHAGEISATTPPISGAGREPIVIPRRFWHLFWNASPATIRVDEHPDYIAARLLRSGDRQAELWAVGHLPAASIEKAAHLRGVGPEEGRRIRNLAKTAASA